MWSRPILRSLDDEDDKNGWSLRHRRGGGGDRRPGLRAGGCAAGVVGRDDRSRRPGQWRLHPQFRLRHRHWPTSGKVWRRALRSRAVWEEVARESGVPILQRGLWLPVRRPEAAAVLEGFMTTEMGEGCRLMSAHEARARAPEIIGPQTVTALWSPHELRIDSRTAIPRLADWLADRFGVKFIRQTAVQAVEPPRVVTGRGVIKARRIVVCPRRRSGQPVSRLSGRGRSGAMQASDDAAGLARF